MTPNKKYEEVDRLRELAKEVSRDSQMFKDSYRKFLEASPLSSNPLQVQCS